MPSERVLVLLPMPCGGCPTSSGERCALAREFLFLVFVPSIQRVGAFPSLEEQGIFVFFYGSPCNIPRHPFAPKHRVCDLFHLLAFDRAVVLRLLDAARELASYGIQMTSVGAPRILLCIFPHPFDLCELKVKKVKSLVRDLQRSVPISLDEKTPR